MLRVLCLLSLLFAPATLSAGTIYSFQFGGLDSPSLLLPTLGGPPSGGPPGSVSGSGVYSYVLAESEKFTANQAGDRVYDDPADDPQGLQFSQSDSTTVSGQGVAAGSALLGGPVPIFCPGPGPCASGAAARSTFTALKARANAFIGTRLGSAEPFVDYYSGATAQASMYDTISASFTGQLLVTLSYAFDGELTGQSSNFLYQLGVLYLDRVASTPDGPIIPGVMFSNLAAGEQIGTVSQPRGPYDESGSFTFDWVDGEKLLIFSGLLVDAGNGPGRLSSEADFYNTAQITAFSAPGNFAINSASGFDWRSVGSTPPGGEVPEPSTALLAATALAALSWWSRRR